MALIPWLLLLFTLTSLQIDVTHSAAQQDTRKVHIVYMGDKPKHDVSLTPSLHANMLKNVVDSRNGVAHESLLLHSYKRSFNGFAAMLTEEEAAKMAGMDGVVSVFPSGKKKLHTTQSWKFIGFPENVERSETESDIIVGMLDTGVWPESNSFTDDGLSPPPLKWKGICQGGRNFTCNNKIIGARFYRSARFFYRSDIASPRDSDGHGTHTASTAAGNMVSEAGLFGLRQGTARGGVPSARIAVYKVCWQDGCDDVDILAAFDDAIADGVDVISISIGGSPEDYLRNSIAIGAFHGLREGVFTSSSAGNEGPGFKTVSHVAPWYLSVGASTIYRKFVTRVQLGNREAYEGIVVNTFDLNGRFYPLISASDAPNRTGRYNERTARDCRPGSLNQTLVRGRIVICSGKSGLGAYYAGAVGVILVGRNVADTLDVYPAPASCLDQNSGSKVYSYYNSTRNPTATIFKSVEVSDGLAPYVPAFSSRGPNPIAPNILKPDITAPGSGILAAWSPIAPISEVNGDGRVASFNIISGTSMACPHASGVAAYIKSFHPNWSSAAILSALVTTAKPMSLRINHQAEFAYGAGNIDPTRALYPGLVYDATEMDYITFLCAEGYNAQLVQAVTGYRVNCSSKSLSSDHINYPSIALSSSDRDYISGVFYRTVTNVGSAESTYKAKVSAPPGLEIRVNPSVLAFTSLGQTQSFSVTIKGSIDSSIASGSLVWDDTDLDFHVRSPIVVYVAL